MKFLTILAHFGDRELAYGIINSLCSFAEGYSYTLCKGRFLHDSQARKEVHNQVSKDLNIKDTFGVYNDLSLPTRKTEELVDNISNLLNTIKPDFVVIHSEDDLHQDHQYLSKASKIAIQEYLKTNNVKVVEVLNNNIFVNIDNFFSFDLDDATLSTKQEVLKGYYTEKFDPESPEHKTEFFKVYEKLHKKIQKHNVFNSKSFKNFLKP